MKKLVRFIAAGHSWRWWVLYVVPLVPIWFLAQWLLYRHHPVWFWIAWVGAGFVVSPVASRLERYWPAPTHR